MFFKRAVPFFAFLTSVGFLLSVSLAPVFAQVVPPTGSTKTAPVEQGTPETPPEDTINPRISSRPPGLTFDAVQYQGEGVLRSSQLAQYIASMYRYGIGISAIAAVIMTVYGGFRYLIGASLGDIKAGKKIIQDAIAGMLIVLGAYLILATVNPATVNPRPIQLQVVIGSDSVNDAAARDAETPGGGGPHSLCRENLRVIRPHTYCAACSNVPCGMATPSTPDAACMALIGPCGGTFGRFLDALTEHCQVKRFDWLESLDGGTFGILHYTEDNFAGLMQQLQNKDAAAYGRVLAAGHNQPVTAAALCAANRSSRGFVCNADYLAMLRTALREPAFTRVQLDNAYAQFTRRMSGASSHFQSPFGQIMWAIVSNNPGSCGASFSNVIAACPAFNGNDENAKIECFLQKYVELGCRGGVVSAGRRARAIRSWLQGTSRSPGASPPPSLAAVTACIPQ